MDERTKPGLLGPLFRPPPRAPFATEPARSRGRLYPEPESPTRTCYQRDRDRIVHSAAFRRLKHKTQVFVQHEGDYYRTRLTHSLEVAQIARSLARVLGLDEDLAETLALAHDLGHPPFGHAGEAALNRCMENFGGFDHNAHALALVTRLERRYAGFDGLNLTWETLEGLVKHNGPLVTHMRTREHLPVEILAFDTQWDLELASQAGPEAQIAALADDIAYVNHDTDDGLRAGLFTLADLSEEPLLGPIVQGLLTAHPELADPHELGRAIGEIVRRLITVLIEDVTRETERRLAALHPKTAAEVRAGAEPVAAFSKKGMGDLTRIKDFLYRRMYRHPRVLEVMGRAQGLVTELFGTFVTKPELLPADWAKACGLPGDAMTARAVCDYIAGMTDGFAAEEYGRVTGREFPL